MLRIMLRIISSKILSYLANNIASTGLEPVTLSLEATYDIQLHHEAG